MVSANRNRRRVSQPIGCDTGERAAEGAGKLRRQLFVDQAADVVLSEDRFGNVHWRATGTPVWVNVAALCSAASRAPPGQNPKSRTAITETAIAPAAVGASRRPW